jgi:hypothetical protein
MARQTCGGWDEGRDRDHEGVEINVLVGQTVPVAKGLVRIAQGW